jgi:hypothetical protein
VEEFQLHRVNDINDNFDGGFADSSNILPQDEEDCGSLVNDDHGLYD